MQTVTNGYSRLEIITIRLSASPHLIFALSFFNRPEKLKGAKTKCMSNIRNSVRLIGKLGQNPEVKNLANDNKLAKFSVATSETYNNDKGEKVTDTNWHNVVAWGKLAGIVEQYCQKGKEVAIEGKLTTRNYTDKEGNKKYVTEVVANEVLLLGAKS